MSHITLEARKKQKNEGEERAKEAVSVHLRLNIFIVMKTGGSCLVVDRINNV